MNDLNAPSKSVIAEEDQNIAVRDNNANLSSEWQNGESSIREGCAVVILLKAFRDTEAGTLTLTELSQIKTPDNLPLMMLSLGWDALLRVASDHGGTMDPWHIRKEFRCIDTANQCNLEIYHDFTVIEAVGRAACHDTMTDEQYNTWFTQYSEQQTQIINNQIQHRLGLNTTDQNDPAAVQEAQLIANKVLEYINNGVANPFALAEIRSMFQAGSSAGTLDMSHMKDLLEEMSETFTDHFVMDHFKRVLLEIERN
jgi:hypothetical protein